MWHGQRNWRALFVASTQATYRPISQLSVTSHPRRRRLTLRGSESLQREVTALCVQYLLRAKRGSVPLDPVARFHLANGARLERLNWMGDTSNNGLQQSLGVTVNYAYRLAEVERNHESFAKAGVIATSREIEAIARKRVST